MPTHAQPAVAQYTLSKIVLIWLAAALPMPVLAFGVAPWLSMATGLHPGIAIWLLMIAGMMWQFVLALLLLAPEMKDGRRDWRDRIWWRAPCDPATGRPALKLLWWTVPVIAATALVEQTPLADRLAAPLLWLIPSLAAVPAPELSQLARPEFIGAWWLMALGLTSFAFNYFLGEELLFRGVLLPRMEGVFGRWAFVANAVAFGAYHLIRPLTIPSIIVSTLFWAFAAQRFRSNWIPLIVHAIEGVVTLAAILAVVSGLAFD